ncbi:aldose 1-epimerase family protein [Wenjunlia tyrosinilytica]|uniref:DUF4432 domain-containing protein n=1 Tax=Wenjunlia tyrosinilytica TaxID=1544741 RepID=A0A918E0X6_9ACTN|nr:aldose 1-epimerase family protein [Wenjunlia tyrosinilytica]GGO94422.1 DUF4432 domain-containing protein [Wenjunlia tyrosinilytica]
MNHLNGLTLADVRRRVGDLRQLARVDQLVEADGDARGARRYRVVTGGGLEFDIHPDRCLDIGAVTYRGVPLAWAAPRDTGPAVSSGAGAADWLRGFRGGLLATCGLDHFGSACEDGGDSFGLHGRIGAHAATEVSTSACPTADGRYGLAVRGQLRQSRLFGENLVLHRTIRTALGSNSIELLDTVVNEGFSAAPHMILYHVNLGWPLLDEGAVLQVPGGAVTARDGDAQRGLTAWHTFGPPLPDWREQVFRHDLPPDSAVQVRLVNERLGLELRLELDSGQLPWLFQWKMLGEGAYVLGVEPANCPVIEGRARAREAGVLPVLAPGERRVYRLVFGVGEVGRAM